MNNKVSVGVTSIVGWVTAFLTLLPTIVSSIESGAVAFNGPEKYLAIFGIASGLITNVARYLQAHKLIGTSIDGVNIENTLNKLDSSTVKNIEKSIEKEIENLIKNPISTLDDKTKDEEIASDIDNIATGTSGGPDGDNSKFDRTVEQELPKPEDHSTTNPPPVPVQS